MAGPSKMTKEEQAKDTFYVLGDLKKTLEQKAKGVNPVLYSTCLEIGEGVSRNIMLESDMENNKVILKIEGHEETGIPAKEFFISTSSQVEGSRIVSGSFKSGLHADDILVASHLKNLIYTMEISSATSRK